MTFAVDVNDSFGLIWVSGKGRKEKDSKMGNIKRAAYDAIKIN